MGHKLSPAAVQQIKSHTHAFADRRPNHFEFPQVDSLIWRGEGLSQSNFWLYNVLSSFIRCSDLFNKHLPEDAVYRFIHNHTLEKPAQGSYSLQLKLQLLLPRLHLREAKSKHILLLSTNPEEEEEKRPDFRVHNLLFNYVIPTNSAQPSGDF